MIGNFCSQSGNTNKVGSRRVIDQYFDSTAQTKSARFYRADASAKDNSNFLSPAEESLTVTIRPPKHNVQGFTLVEMLVTLIVAGIITGIAIPSFLSLNKPLKNGSLQLKSHLSLIRSKAISSNKAYRLRPKYPTAAEYKGQVYQQTPHNFVVEYAANCQVNTAAGGTTGWERASQLDLDLPEQVGIAASVPRTPNIITITRNGVVTTPPVDPLVWDVCYDNRGVAINTVSVVLQDFQANNIAKYALVEIIGVGSIDITTKTKEGYDIPLNGDNPTF